MAGGEQVHAGTMAPVMKTLSMALCRGSDTTLWSALLLPLRYKLMCRSSENSCNLIIMSSFFPPSKRGSHVKSTYECTITQHSPLNPIASYLRPVFGSLAVSTWHHVLALHPCKHQLSVATHPREGGFAWVATDPREGGFVWFTKVIVFKCSLY